MGLSTADEDLLLEQVSVDPAYPGNRIGSTLIEKAGENARDKSLSVVVLTTYSDIPWNGPLYRCLGSGRCGTPRSARNSGQSDVVRLRRNSMSWDGSAYGSG